jgi:F0F1-type ATP synthase assembly protein I
MLSSNLIFAQQLKTTSRNSKMNEKVSEKKGVSRTVAITLVIICIILLVGIAYMHVFGIDTFTIIGLLLLGIGIIMGLGFLLHRRKMQGMSEPSQPMPS